MRGPRPFRFEAAWIIHDSYHLAVKEAWNDHQGNPVEALNKVRDDSIQ